MGLGAPLQYVVQASWNFGSYRTIFQTELPTGSYDFIASLPAGNREALQHEIQRQFGLIGHVEMVKTNVLILKVKSQNAPGLARSEKPEGGMTSTDKMFECEGEPISILAGCCLEGRLGIPVVDRTGLKGNFDINLKWKPDDLNDLKKTLTDQLGLELVAGNEPIEMLVIEKAR